MLALHQLLLNQLWIPTALKILSSLLQLFSCVVTIILIRICIYKMDLDSSIRDGKPRQHQDIDHARSLNRAEPVTSEGGLPSILPNHLACHSRNHKRRMYLSQIKIRNSLKIKRLPSVTTFRKLIRPLSILLQTQNHSASEMGKYPHAQRHKEA